jgi:FOG: Ankyrin repeat
LLQASKGVDIEGGHQNVTNSWKLTPLTVAMLKNNIGCLKKLLSYPGTNVNCKDEQGRTLIMCAIEGLDHQNFEQIKYLIKEKGAALDIEDNSGRTALHYACDLNPTDLASGSVPNWHELDAKEKEKRIEEYTKLRVLFC